MPLWKPHAGDRLVESNISAAGSATPGTAVTTGGAAGTKGTAVELIAATAFDCYRVHVMASGYGANAAASEGCLDILIGTATEEVLIADLLMGYCGTLAGQDRGPKVWTFPLHIPAGQRIAARAAGARTSTAVNVVVVLEGGDGLATEWWGTKVTTYGVSAAPNGTDITAGASGAQGSWTEITSGTSEAGRCIIPSLQANGGTTSIAAREVHVGIGLGSATEELIGVPWIFTTDNVETMAGPHLWVPVIKDIPASTRLTMRVSNSGTIAHAFEGALHVVS